MVAQGSSCLQDCGLQFRYHLLLEGPSLKTGFTMILPCHSPHALTDSPSCLVGAHHAGSNFLYGIHHHISQSDSCLSHQSPLHSHPQTDQLMVVPRKSHTPILPRFFFFFHSHTFIQTVVLPFAGLTSRQLQYSA